MIFAGLVTMAGGYFLSRFNSTGYPLLVGGAVLIIVDIWK